VKTDQSQSDENYDENANATTRASSFVLADDESLPRSFFTVL